MKYIRNNKNSKVDYNLIFIYQDNLSAASRAIGKGVLCDDFKSSVDQKIVTGKAGSLNVFASKIYEKNYITIGLGDKNKLSIQGFEKCFNVALKLINEYNISSISIDITNISIKNYDLIKGSITEIEKAQYNYRNLKLLTLKQCFLNISGNITNKEFNKYGIKAF